MADVARLLLQGTDVVSLTQAVVSKVTELFDFDRCSVARLEPEEDTYELLTWYESRPEHDPIHVPEVSLDKGLAGRVISTRRPTYVPSYEGSVMDLEVVDVSMEGGSLRSLLAVPLLATGHVYGAMVLGAERAMAFSRADIKIARQVADMLALAYERQIQSNRLENMVDRLQRANLELDTFIYSASHDLRAPLLSIAGLTDLSRLALAMGNKEELTEYLDRIHRNVQRLDGVVIDILQLNRARRMEQAPEETNLLHLMAEVVELLAAMDDAHRCDIRVRCNVREPISLERRRVRQVLNNLIANGIKFKDLKKEDPYVQVNADIDGKDLVISVHDNGVGIPPGQEDRIFDMFYRATNHAYGSGLGLYLVREHAQAMGATVSARTEDGETVFEVRMPALVAEAPPARPPLPTGDLP
jgi:signal transduction histidine kinase